MLGEDLGIANRRIDDLLAALSDALTAAMFSSIEAAALRAQLELLTGPRRRWWRRWWRRSSVANRREVRQTGNRCPKL